MSSPNLCHFFLRRLQSIIHSDGESWSAGQKPHVNAMPALFSAVAGPFVVNWWLQAAAYSSHRHKKPVGVLNDVHCVATWAHAMPVSHHWLALRLSRSYGRMLEVLEQSRELGHALNVVTKSASQSLVRSHNGMIGANAAASIMSTSLSPHSVGFTRCRSLLNAFDGTIIFKRHPHKSQDNLQCTFTWKRTLKKQNFEAIWKNLNSVVYY